MRTVGPAVILVAMVLTRSAAAADCESKTCVSSTSSRDGWSVTLTNRCDAAVHCEVCPSLHGKVDLAKCAGADLEAGAKGILKLASRSDHTAVECFAADNVEECGGKKSANAAEPVPDAPPPASADDTAADTTEHETRDAQVERAREVRRMAESSERGHGIHFAPRSSWEGAGSGKFTFEALAGGAVIPPTGESGTAGATGLGTMWGAGVRFAIQGMAAPTGGDTTWFGVRAGMGLDFGAALSSVTTTVGFNSMSTSSTNFAFQVPLFVGFQASLGSFDTPTQWTGWTIGLDYQPWVYAYPASGVAPVGFNIHVASAEYEPRATATLHPHIDFNLYFVAPVNAPATVGFSIGLILQ